jgi:hypothetical protein
MLLEEGARLRCRGEGDGEECAGLKKLSHLSALQRDFQQRFQAGGVDFVAGEG